nr:Ig-like domain-containing protein [Lachnospiraceae bacterium]
MFRRKTITRITRFMLLSMLMSYCMSFTVCAEEDPVTGMLAGSASRMVYAADEGEEVIGITDVAVETSEDVDTEDEEEVSEEPLAGSEYNIRAIDYKLGDRHQIIVRFESDYYTIPGNITINYNGKTATAECVERGDDYLVPIEWVSFDVEDDVINNFSANLYSDWGMSGANVTIDEYTEVHDNVIDADNFFDVFKYNYEGNRLYDYIDTDSTLYFAGDFPTSYGQGNYSMIIDRPVNIDTEVGGARFTRQDHVECYYGCAVNVINFTSEASGSSIRNIYFENGTIVVNATDIVIDSVRFDTDYKKRNTKSIDVSEQSNNTLIKNSTMNEVQISGNMTMLEYCDIKGDSHRFYQTGGYLHNNTIVNCQVSGTGIEISGNDFKSSLTVYGEENHFSKNRFECSPEVAGDENQLWDNTFDYGISLNSDGNYFQNNTMTGSLIVHGKNNAIYDNTNTAGNIEITGNDNCLINNNIGNNLYAASADNLVVEDCTVAVNTEIAGNATEFTGNVFGGKVKITGNTTTICGNEIDGSIEVKGEGNLFSDNTVNCDGQISGAGTEICRNIFSLDSETLFIEDNVVFYDNRVNDGQLTISGAGSRATNNIIERSSDPALRLSDQSGGNTVSDNKIKGGDKTGTAAINDEGVWEPQNAINDNYGSLRTGLSVNVDNISFGQKAIVNIAINYFATGKVEFTINSTHYETTVAKGAGRLEVPGLVLGNYSVNAWYLGDDDVDFGTAETSFLVGKTANALTTLPAAKEGLIANNSTQELISKGVNIAGKLEYALGTDET